MQYRFPSFKVYFIFVAILLFIFLLCFIPSAKISLFLTPEPLIVDFDFNVSTQVEKRFFHINTIPGEIVSIVKARANPEFQLVDSLVFDNGHKALIFSKKDLKDFVDYKVKNILKDSIDQMEVQNFHPEKWDVRVTDKKDMSTSATLRVSISENTYPIVNKDNLKRRLVFSTKEQAKKEIKDRIDVEKIEIKTKPFLYDRLPVFKGRISFDIK